MHWASALFLLLHGLIHASWLSPPPEDTGGPVWPFGREDSWLLCGIGMSADAIRVVATILAALSVAGFIASALGALGFPGLSAAWPALTVASSVVSLTLIVVFWHIWFPVGLALDVVLIVTTLGGWWPSTLVS